MSGIICPKQPDGACDYTNRDKMKTAEPNDAYQPHARSFRVVNMRCLYRWRAALAPPYINNPQEIGNEIGV